MIFLPNLAISLDKCNNDWYFQCINCTIYISTLNTLDDVAANDMCPGFTERRRLQPVASEGGIFDTD